MTQAERRVITPQAESSRPSFMARLMLALGLLAFGALLLFLFQNLHQAEIHFLWFEWTTRMLWALLVSALFGVVSTLILTVLFLRRGRGKPGSQSSTSKAGR